MMTWAQLKAMEWAVLQARITAASILRFPIAPSDKEYFEFARKCAICERAICQARREM